LTLIATAIIRLTSPDTASLAPVAEAYTKHRLRLDPRDGGG
jgi:hypothetical protein